jgi:hypothetical protein
VRGRSRGQQGIDRRLQAIRAERAQRHRLQRPARPPDLESRRAAIPAALAARLESAISATTQRSSREATACGPAISSSSGSVTQPLFSWPWR